jgi:hypothetical protein
MELREPPTHLRATRLSLRRTPASLTRIADPKYPNPIHWSRAGKSRFDSPEAPLGVFYLGEDLETAILEVFGSRWLDLRILQISALARFNVFVFALKTPYRCVDLTGKGLSLAGADANLCTSLDYPVTQRWAAAFMRHPQNPKGLAYHSRLNPKKTSYALFGSRDRDQDFVLVSQSPLLDAPGARTILNRYRVALIR